jgi:hypothetical protein
LILLLHFLKNTKDDVLQWKMNDNCIVKWYLDASFGVHDDLKSHTGAITQVVLNKQKPNTRSSTEAKLIPFGDIATKVYGQFFLKEQGYEVAETILYRDNQTAMKLEVNGKLSSGKRTQHFHITYFFMNDLINQKEVKVEFCPTNMMISDYMTKPLIGLDSMKGNEQQECVGACRHLVSEENTKRQTDKN